MNNDGRLYYNILRIVVVGVGVALLSRLIWMQFNAEEYIESAKSNSIESVIEFPMRGEVFDRNGEYIVKSRACYDVMVVYRQLPEEGFDTTRLINILDISREKLEKQLREARNNPRASILIVGYVSQDDKLRLDEMNISGISTRYRTAREYPRKVGGNLLGYVSEVNQNQVDKWQNNYVVGEYAGTTGLEAAYEDVLRGKKGMRYYNIDAHQAIIGPHNEGRDDVLPVRGLQITTTIDVRLQEFAEELMEGKIGSVVAIEPSTGEILVMVSSPSYNPDLLVGRQRGNNYMELFHDQRNPQFNRSVKAKYPPGSTFKLVQGLIAMQEGVLTPNMRYSCNMGYKYGGRTMGCHAHASPLDLRDAVAQSCNAYFCQVFKDMITNPKYGSVREGVRVWNEYVYSFGFGHKLGTDLYGEGAGNVPTPEDYDKMYNGRWNYGSVLSCSIGQGEMGCTPLQMANLAAIIANRGYYYTPHLVKAIEGRDSIDARFYERHYTMVDSIHYIPIVEGMWRSVNVSGTSRTAYLQGWDVCGKTGTAENSGPDHSTFLSFAPKDNPQIAISVYVEHGGFGSAIAVPIASLIEEMYLTGTVQRPELVERVKAMKPNYRKYDEMQRKYDAKREKK